MTGGRFPHAINFLGLASATDGGQDAQVFSEPPEVVAAGIVGLGLTLALEAYAVHSPLVHPVRELVGGIGGGRVRDPHSHRTG
jgi:hypothetical protein